MKTWLTLLPLALAACGTDTVLVPAEDAGTDLASAPPDAHPHPKDASADGLGLPDTSSPIGSVCGAATGEECVSLAAFEALAKRVEEMEAKLGGPDAPKPKYVYDADGNELGVFIGYYKGDGIYVQSSAEPADWTYLTYEIESGTLFLMVNSSGEIRENCPSKFSGADCTPPPLMTTNLSICSIPGAPGYEQAVASVISSNCGQPKFCGGAWWQCPDEVVLVPTGEWSSWSMDFATCGDVCKASTATLKEDGTGTYGAEFVQWTEAQGAPPVKFKAPLTVK